MVFAIFVVLRPLTITDIASTVPDADQITAQIFRGIRVLCCRVTIAVRTTTTSVDFDIFSVFKKAAGFANHLALALLNKDTFEGYITTIPIQVLAKRFADWSLVGMVAAGPFRKPVGSVE